MDRQVPPRNFEAALGAGTRQLFGARVEARRHDISQVRVRSGVARDCPRFSQGRYAEAERDAAANGATIGRTYRLPGYCR